MYAIISLGGHQHKVKKDDVFLAELTVNEPGQEFSTNEVLIVGEGTGIKVGKPFVSGAQVKLKVLEAIRGPKVHGFRYRRRKGTRRSWGHRQDLHKLQVVEIKA
jgi:large subunit ribosomal protein L21